MIASKLRTARHSYAWRVVCLFLGLLVVYLLISKVFLAPLGYYGTIDQPRFADPWIARSQTILSGALLYRDVFTSTPPLTNLLLLIPSLVPIYAGNINPWATLSFMLFFSLFNLFTALLLLRMLPTKAAGFRAALIFLLNPLTFGNSVLRRQDESIVVFFVALALFFLLQERHILTGVAIGASLLVKLSGGIIIPIAFLHRRDWRYLLLPAGVFLVGLAPFLILAGRDAIFWDFGKSEAQHPFQFGGVSLVALWNSMATESGQVALMTAVGVMGVGVGSTLVLIAWKRLGIVRDLIILTTAILLFTPKLHTGYFSLLVLFMAIVIKRWPLAVLFSAFGAFAIVADFYKWPVADFTKAFWFMVVTLALMVSSTIALFFQPQPRSTSSPSAEVGSVSTVTPDQ